MALVIISSGLYSHRGTDWRKSGVFDRLTVSQKATTYQPGADSYQIIKRLQTGVVVGMLAVLTLILFAHEWITRRPRLWRVGRIGFLTTTLFVLGWGLNGQLSVVQVVAFIHSLMNGFRWETFLIEPVVFLLWGFTALGLLFWGRGVYCRYLCPLGAAMAIPAKLKIFDWLKRRPQCGRDCRLCETKCTVGAIDPLGRINPDECVLCLRCQIIMNDAHTCTVLKRRARTGETA
ncbi:4Fe-4S binding protein [Pseudorhodobacter sp. W20_MBD10_FR17]|uniref:4Fe-4S binding protein n=1 Tax=Pseudorhodobacter sp. W20_MBD10_FR17 TaxID=3240266 RepID=UPI003F998BC8